MAAAAAHFTSSFRLGNVAALKKIKVYQQTECCRDNLIRGRDITTSGLQKQTSAVLEFFSWVSFRPHHRQRHFILHRTIKCHPNRTILCRVMMSYQFSRWRPHRRNFTSSFGLCVVQWVVSSSVSPPVVNKSKSIRKLNVVGISQSTAEI